MTGYASSSAPETGTGIGRDQFLAGGGYAFATRVDIQRRWLWFGPTVAFWNNLTGNPDPNADINYFQIELGGRLLAHTRTIPSLYAGVGAGYTFAHGKIIPKWYGNSDDFDGDFPTGSLHFGVKTPTRTTGLGIIAEGSYHFGLEDARGYRGIGPARAWLIQIGVVFDLRFPGDKS